VATLAYHRVMSDTLQLPDHVAAFLAAPGRFATLASIDPDGAPRQAVIWYLFEPDGRITINSLEGRRWPANLRRDSRLSLAIADPADAYHFVALTGVVDEVVADQGVARGEISAMAHRYHPDDPASAEKSIAGFVNQQRISFRIRITAFHDHLS
jgi:PPOX class probable F420-dependent enzyme